MDLGIKGKTALVGGASAGIGLAAARALAAEGVRVALVARREKELTDASASVAKDFGVEAIPIRADLTEEREPERVVAEAAKRFGALDIVVANSGGPRAGHFAEVTDSDWETAFRVTYLSTVRFARAALPHMQQGGWGRIVVVGSLVTTEPRPELVLSSGLRTGLVALVRLLARQHGKDGIRVNMVSPGYTRTARLIEATNAKREETGRGTMQAFRAIAAEIPAGRLAEPEEIAAVIAFLCSEPGGFVNGINLVADGGQQRGV